MLFRGLLKEQWFLTAPGVMAKPLLMTGAGRGKHAEPARLVQSLFTARHLKITIFMGPNNKIFTYKS